VDGYQGYSAEGRQAGALRSVHRRC
jgi:hypothetical protein